MILDQKHISSIDTSWKAPHQDHGFWDHSGEHGKAYHQEHDLEHPKIVSNDIN